MVKKGLNLALVKTDQFVSRASDYFYTDMPEIVLFFREHTIIISIEIPRGFLMEPCGFPDV